MAWKQLDDRHLRNTTRSDSQRVARTFGPDGQSWPRICVVVQPHLESGFTINWSSTSGPGSWWVDRPGLPEEILRAIPEMVNLFLMTRI